MWSSLRHRQWRPRAYAWAFSLGCLILLPRWSGAQADLPPRNSEDTAAILGLSTGAKSTSSRQRDAESVLPQHMYFNRPMQKMPDTSTTSGGKISLQPLEALTPQMRSLQAPDAEKINGAGTQLQLMEDTASVSVLPSGSRDVSTSVRRYGTEQQIAHSATGTNLLIGIAGSGAVLLLGLYWTYRPAPVTMVSMPSRALSQDTYMRSTTAARSLPVVSLPRPVSAPLPLPRGGHSHPRPRSSTVQRQHTRVASPKPSRRTVTPNVLPVWADSTLWQDGPRSGHLAMECPIWADASFWHYEDDRREASDPLPAWAIPHIWTKPPGASGPTGA